MPRILAAVLVCILLAPPTAAAITIDTVPVGDPGNAADPSDGDSGGEPGIQHYGGVPYAFRIGTTEITTSQYVAFLNAVAADDTYGVYHVGMTEDPGSFGIIRSGSPGSYTYSVAGGANKPIEYINWARAARFANWLDNGQPSGPQNASTTEDGAYTLNGANTDAALLAVVRNPGAKWFLPTENEWYKAAYYQPTSKGGDVDGYWKYPTKTNSLPFSDQPPGSDAPLQSNTGNFFVNDNLANGYNDGFAVTASTTNDVNQDYRTDVGAYTESSSFYGTFDQGGNDREWLESLTLSGIHRVVRGGSYTDPSQAAGSSIQAHDPPTLLGSNFTFRVATVPEPSTLALAAFGALGLLIAARRRR